MAVSQTEGDFLTLHELVRAAHKKLERNIWDYLIGGTATETTLLRNRQALDRIALRPRVLRDVSGIDPSHRFLGKMARLPVVLAPIGGLESLATDGGMSTARAASAFGVPFILSSISEAGMQMVGKAARRSGSVTPSGRNVPPGPTSPKTSSVGANMRSISPASSPVRVCAVPRYGTCNSSIPAMLANEAPTRWFEEPTPPEP